MGSKLILRLASGLMFLHAIGHTLGALTWDKAPNAGIEKVVRDMKDNTFQFMGRTSSLATFYIGYGIIMIFVFIWISFFLWILSNDPGGKMSRQFLLVLTLFLFCMGVAEYIYFFPLAAGFTLLACLLTGIVFLKRNVPI